MLAQQVQDWRALPPIQKQQFLERLQERRVRQSAVVTVSTDKEDSEKLHCKTDVVYWCNTYVKTHDPRRKPAFLPFVLFPRQVEFLQWLDERQRLEEDGLVEKSRDSGLTWMCAAYAVHKWLFEEAIAIGFGSRKEAYVDRIGDPASILGKCRIIIRNLPAWMQPSNLTPKQHLGYCKLINPQTEATITGEAGDNIGRGDRKSIYFVDEAAFIEHPDLIDAALSQTTNCRIDVSTPNGSGNSFYRKRHSGTVPVFRFHWTDDPRKGPEWYARQLAKHDPVTVAQEIDIDYTASVEGITIPAKWVAAAINLQLPANGPKIGGYDVADDGPNKNVMIGRQGPVAFKVEAWGQLNTTQSAHKSVDVGRKMGLVTLHYDCIGVGAGVKGAYDSMESRPSFRPVAVNVGDGPTSAVWPDGKHSQEKFVNLRAEGWWLLRTRFEKTFEHVSGEATHPLDELISIPNEPELIAQLSQPKWFRTETGKIQIESKKDMQKRGIKSPDHADALMMAFLPDQTPVFNQGVFRR